MPNTLLRASRLVVVAVVAYLAAACALSTQDQNPPKTAVSSAEAPPVSSGEAPSKDRLAEVQLRVARTAFEEGSLKTALDLFEKAHKSTPGAVEPLIGKGDALFGLRRFEAAEAAYRAASARDPASFEAQEGLGKTLVTLEKYRDGLRAFEAARAIREDATLLNKIGVTHELMGDGAAAQKHFRAALALDPKSLTARNNLALSLAVSGSYDAALSEMEDVVADPRSSERHHANLAFIYGLAGRPMDKAPAKVLRAAANKGWDAAFFARTRKAAESGDRAAILALLNNSAPQTAARPEAPTGLADLPEMPADSEAAPEAATAAPATTMADTPKSGPASPVSPRSPAPAMAAAAPAEPAPAAALEAPVSPAAPAATTASEPPADNFVTAPEQTAATMAGETIATIVPPSPEVPADMAGTVSEAPADAPAEPAAQIVMRAPDMPIASEAAARTAGAAPGVTHHVQLGAWRTRWLGRALRQLGPLTADILPEGRVEVVRGPKYHTLRSVDIERGDEARRICAALRERKVDCFVTRQTRPPAGQAFDIGTAGEPAALALFLASVDPIPPAADQGAGGPEKAVAALRPTPDAAAAPAGANTAPTAGTGEYRVQFAAYRSAAHLIRGLDVLRHRAGDMLPAVVKLVRAATPHGTSIPYRLRSVPLESRAAAADLCRSLSEKGLDCLVIRHSAQAWLPLS